MKYKGKKVLILGLGLNEGGVGSARFFAKQGADVLVTDLKDEEALKPSLEKLTDFPNIKYHLGVHKKEDIDWADLVIRNQAIKPDNEFLKYAREKGKEIETDIGIFLDYVNPDQLIGVTGTKGKSTTSSLIYEILHKSAGVNSIHPKGVNSQIILAGNIGRSVLDSIDLISPDTLVILEISSFQLESFDEKKVSPHIALITNIYPDHLNYHNDMAEYIFAKKMVANNQTSKDYLFLNRDDKILTSEDFLKDLEGQIIYFSADDLPKDFVPTLPGDHNKVNYAAALAVAKGINIPEDQALKNMNEFKGAEFRLQFIKEYKGFKIYNDSTATNPDATIAALNALGDFENEEFNFILIVGGMNKGLQYEKLSSEIAHFVDTLYFIEGDIVDKLLCDTAVSVASEGRFNNLEDLLKKLKKDIDSRDYFKTGGVILFSPGATSFNLFQNEFDRGRKFNQAVEKIFI